MVKRKSTFLGEQIAQSPFAVSMWESILAPLQFKRIIELGTWWGNFSLYLYLFCKNRDVPFYTYDIVRQKGTRLKRLVGFDSSHRRKDIFQNIDEIAALIQKPGLTILFCDGGDKPKEFRTFVKYLKPGDIIAVHDWMYEIFPKDVQGRELRELQPEIVDGMTKFFQAV